MDTQFFTKQKPDPTKFSVMTVGNFDGVHLGHQKIVSKLSELSKADKNAIALSFNPHPREVLGNASMALISTLHQRAQKIATLDQNIVYGAITFDHAFSQLTDEAFLRALMAGWNMSDLVIGTTTHLGRNRMGTPDRLQALARQLGFKLHVVEPMVLDGHIVSSSIIRRSILKGDVHRAKAMMGELFKTTGEVMRHSGLGTKLGVPTANLACLPSELLPCDGVYAAWVCVEQNHYPAAVNLGYRPTVTQKKAQRLLEAHVLSTTLDLAGKSIEVHWVERIREECKFESLGALQTQIQKDITKIKKTLDQTPFG